MQVQTTTDEIFTEKCRQLEPAKQDESTVIPNES